MECAISCESVAFTNDVSFCYSDVTFCPCRSRHSLTNLLWVIDWQNSWVVLELCVWDLEAAVLGRRTIQDSNTAQREPSISLLTMILCIVTRIWQNHSGCSFMKELYIEMLYCISSLAVSPRDWWEKKRSEEKKEDHIRQKLAIFYRLNDMRNSQLEWRNNPDTVPRSGSKQYLRKGRTWLYTLNTSNRNSLPVLIENISSWELLPHLPVLSLSNNIFLWFWLSFFNEQNKSLTLTSELSQATLSCSFWPHPLNDGPLQLGSF